MRIGIVGIEPCDGDGKWEYFRFRDRLEEIFEEEHLTPTAFASIGIGLSKMVRVYAKISRKPFEIYKPHWLTNATFGISLIQRNHTLCSKVDHLILFGQLHPVMKSIIDIARMKNVPLHCYDYLVPGKSSNSLGTPTSEYCY